MRGLITELYRGSVWLNEHFAGVDGGQLLVLACSVLSSSVLVAGDRVELLRGDRDC